MTIESSQFINQLNTSFPRSTDLLKEGDDHIRLIKANLKNTFPNITTSISMTSDTLNYLNNSLKASPTGIVFNNSVSTTGGAGVDFSSTDVKIGNAIGDPATFNGNSAINFNTLRAIYIAMHPVGFVICTGESNTNPGTLPLLRGTGWTPYGAGRYMVSAGNGGDMGPWGIGLGSAGDANFSVTYNNMPSHSHEMNHTHHIDFFTQGMNRNNPHSHMTHGAGGSDGYHAAEVANPDSNNNFPTDNTDINHEHQVVGDTQGTRDRTGAEGGGQPITYTPAFTSAYYWKRTS